MFSEIKTHKQFLLQDAGTESFTHFSSSTRCNRLKGADEGNLAAAEVVNQVVPGAPAGVSQGFPW